MSFTCQIHQISYSESQLQCPICAQNYSENITYLQRGQSIGGMGSLSTDIRHVNIDLQIKLQLDRIEAMLQELLSKKDV